MRTSLSVHQSVRLTQKKLRPKMDRKFWGRYIFFSPGIVLQDKFFGLELFWESYEVCSYCVRQFRSKRFDGGLGWKNSWLLHWILGRNHVFTQCNGIYWAWNVQKSKTLQTNKKKKDVFDVLTVSPRRGIMTLQRYNVIRSPDWGWLCLTSITIILHRYFLMLVFHWKIIGSSRKDKFASLPQLD